MCEPKRILVVDDQPSVLFVLREALTRMGDEYEVCTAGGGIDALDKVKKGHFDLVLTDIQMSDMDGIFLTEEIRALAEDTLVLWLTGYSCYSLRSEAHRLGVYRCLNKPLRIETIRRVVSQALDDERKTA